MAKFVYLQITIYINPYSNWELSEFLKINSEYIEDFLEKISFISKNPRFIFNAKCKIYGNLGDYLNAFICLTIDNNSYVYIKQSNFRR